jgi:hypothetical protein
MRLCSRLSSQSVFISAPGFSRRPGPAPDPAAQTPAPGFVCRPGLLRLWAGWAVGEGRGVWGGGAGGVGGGWGLGGGRAAWGGELSKFGRRPPARPPAGPRLRPFPPPPPRPEPPSARPSFPSHAWWKHHGCGSPALPDTGNTACPSAGLGRPVPPAPPPPLSASSTGRLLTGWATGVSQRVWSVCVWLREGAIPSRSSAAATPPRAAPTPSAASGLGTLRLSAGTRPLGPGSPHPPARPGSSSSQARRLPGELLLSSRGSDSPPGGTRLAQGPGRVASLVGRAGPLGSLDPRSKPAFARWSPTEAPPSPSSRVPGSFRFPSQVSSYQVPALLALLEFRSVSASLPVRFPLGESSDFRLPTQVFSTST